LLNNKKIIQGGQYKFFYYSKKPPISDFISIIGPSLKNKFIDNNLINQNLRFIEGPYETKEVKLEEGDVVIDAGAHLGFFSVLASSKIGGHGKCFSFEPMDSTRELLKENLRLNNVTNVEVYPYALGDCNQKIDFFASSDYAPNASGYFQNEGKKLKVNEIKLDDFVEKFKLEKLNFIKADIEGMERCLLKGAERTIKKFRPKIVICIYHRKDDPELIERMIKTFVSDYKIIKTDYKLYAWV